MLRIVFCGTPQFAVPCLEAVLAAGHMVPLVLAQPDRPVGRGLKLTAPPVKEAALRHGIRVLQPEKIKNNAELQEVLRTCTATLPDPATTLSSRPDRSREATRGVEGPATHTVGNAKPFDSEQSTTLSSRPERSREATRGVEGPASPPDILVVVAYGRILPPWMLELPRLGCVNVHASLLPKYRGAAPIQWALARGENVTGITTMQMDAGLDTGDMLLQRELDIPPEWRAPELADALSGMGAELLVETLKQIEDGSAKRRRQDDSAATLAPLLSREDARVRWQMTAREIWDRWRGFYPWPGCSASLDGEPLQLRALRVVGRAEVPANGIAPGTCEVRDGRWFVQCGDGAWIEVLEAQAPGRRSLPAAQFLAGYRPLTGLRLDT